MKKASVIHPFLFAVFPVLSFYVHNIDELVLDVIFMPTAVTTCFTFLAWLLLNRVLKDKEKVGVFITLSLLSFFSYGYFYDSIPDVTVWGLEIRRHRYIFLFWSIICLCGGYFIKKRKSFHNLTIGLNLGAAFLVIISVINIGVYEFKRRAVSQGSRSIENTGNNIINLREADTDTLRDIYYIIFDRYASSSTLKEYYNYDNSEFTNYLTNKGFYVASESRCNYPATYLSLASSLNMKYLNYLTDKVGEASTDRTIVYEMLQDYEVWRFLTSKGYKFIHFGSSWGPTQRNKYADMNIYPGILSDFSRTLLFEITVIKAFYDKFFRTSYHRNRILYKFDKLSEMPNIQGPKFVFAHMLIPHPPYLFDRNGEPLTEQEVKKRSKKENYINYLIFANTKIKRLVDEIMLKSKDSAIIVLQADEGPYLITSNLTEAEKIDRLNKKALRIRTRIFNAIYLPGSGKNILNIIYKSITPVNTFRAIFNLYFDTNMELLNDESYITGGSPYKFINVTDKVKYD